MGEKLYCENCGEHFATITGDDPEYTGTCKCGAQHFIRASTAGMEELATLRADNERLELNCAEWKEVNLENLKDNERLNKTVDAATQLCQVYYEIAESAIGEDAVKSKRDARINELLGVGG